MTSERELKIDQCPFCGNANPRLDKVSGAGAPERQDMVSCHCGALVPYHVWKIRRPSQALEGEWPSVDELANVLFESSKRVPWKKWENLSYHRKLHWLRQANKVNDAFMAKIKNVRGK